MAECINCKKKLGLLSEKYWFQHAGEEKLWACKECKPKVEKEFNAEEGKRHVIAEMIEGKKIKLNQKWEYKVLEIEVKASSFMGVTQKLVVDAQLNELGDKGWELVSAASLQGRDLAYTVPGSTVRVAFIFKRKI